MKQFFVDKSIHIWIIVSAVLVSFVLHFPVFNYDIIGYHVWRQTQTQTVIENFCTQDFCILNPRLNNLVYPEGIIRMEFPLFQWIVACFCKLSGNHVLTTRVVTFVIGVFSMIGFYLLAKSVFKNKILAAIGAWAICFSPVFYYYAVNPLPDNLALCFGIYALYFFVEYVNGNKLKQLIFFSIFISLSVLCKLPFILFAIPFAVYWMKSTKKLKELNVVSAFLLPAIVWYGSVMGTWGDNGIIKGVFTNNVDLMTYLDYLQFNFLSTLPELFINYAALFIFGAGVYYFFKNKLLKENMPAKYLFFGMLAVIAYALFELNMIAKVHDYYLFPFLPFLFLIVLYGFKTVLSKGNKFLKALAVICIVLLPLTAYLRSQTRWNVTDPGFNPALLSNKKQIQKIIPENAICLTGNDDSGMVYLYYLNRMGYTFYENQLDNNLIEEYKRKGVSYLISDAQLSEETLNFLPKPLADFNDLKIFKLK